MYSPLGATGYKRAAVAEGNKTIGVGDMDEAHAGNIDRVAGTLGGVAALDGPSVALIGGWLVRLAGRNGACGRDSDYGGEEESGLGEHWNEKDRLSGRWEGFRTVVCLELKNFHGPPTLLYHSDVGVQRWSSDYCSYCSNMLSDAKHPG